MARCARGPDLPPRSRPTEPEQNTSRTVTMTDPRVTIPSFARYWLAPSYRTAEPGEAEALDLLAEILGGGMRSRLYQQLVVKSDLAAATGAYYDGVMLDGTSFVRLRRRRAMPRAWRNSRRPSMPRLPASSAKAFPPTSWKGRRTASCAA